MELYYIALKTRILSLPRSSFPASSLGLAPDRVHVASSDSLVYATERIMFNEDDEDSHSVIIFFDFKSLCGYDMVGHNVGVVEDFISIEEHIDSPVTDTAIYCKTCLKSASFLRGVKDYADKYNTN